MPQHVVVTGHNPQWQARFREEAQRIRDILGENCIAVHHIGSTAVPDLKAKPILDILPVVRDIGQVDALAPAFRQLGYEYMGAFGIPGRRYLRKGGDNRTHQVHIFAQSSQADIVRHLAVRDYLRTHRERADGYGSLKESLARKFPYDIDAYCDGKDAFMKELEQEALAWWRGVTAGCGPNPDAVHPNPAISSVCYIKNSVTRPNLLVGDYTYYDDPVDSEHFENHVTHHYEFLGDKLIIGRFCAIAKGVEFIMNGANHRMGSVTTYPFNIMGHGWEKSTPTLEALPFKGDTVVGNDVWIGQNVTILPGVHIGDGAIIGANSVVAKDIPAYHIAGGNPCKIIRKRFDDELIDYLLKIQWWNWSAWRIFENLEVLCSGDLTAIRKIDFPDLVLGSG